MGIDQFRHITLQQLEAFVVLVEERSFSGAAKRLLLSQPSLSKHVKNLEIFVDCRLINRSRDGISLTEEGSVLLGFARKILKLRDEARDKIASVKDTASGHVSIGTSTIPSTYIIPAMLKGLKELHRDIHVHLLSGDSEDVLEMVINSRVEIGFIGKPVQDGRVLCEPVWKDELVLVAGRESPFEEDRMYRVEDLLNAPFVLREKGSGTRAVLEDYLKKQGYPPLSRFTTACELGSSEAVKEAVISGLGISILSIHAVKRELRSGLLRRISLDVPRIERSFFLITRKQFLPLPHHRVFIDFARRFSIEV
ncbi:MAG TPA: selenium metabolism-associated LysR family transcriptional regulator [Deltaproteobacteria bacterium]|jgi:DNA-binding transcriptional LysR family regulator|nr:selenium metabolism-associated LysR family transcriptional regulator [Deltaproteobacteria bacterium]HOI08137.1 selenium metabolism-associated LysR family transcriptional regulator [Deltaproteobacteria bacterium]